MQQEELQELVRKYLNGTATDAEKMLLSDWYQNQNVSEIEWMADIAHEERLLKEELFVGIQKQIAKNKRDKIRRLWPNIATAAASILLFLSTGAYFILHNKPFQQVIQKQDQDIRPATNKATLTLANGRKIVLTNGLSGKLAQQGKTAIQINSNGAIAYVSSLQANKNVLPVTYNTLSTSKGEQSPYPLILPDGTKIWLNAASSITFPTAFIDNERLVKVTGEGYFEVMHNAAHPFKIAVKGLIIEDIGTHFNINAYDDEPSVKTTLLEGGIKISKGTQTLSIKPGQQAFVDENNLIKINNGADTEEALAWKNGFFQFNHADIKTVMRQISRWYDVDIKYEGSISDKSISGKIYRNVNASQALQILSYLKINYRIEKLPTGKKIIITP